MQLSGDEHRASRALRESSLALYAAESGLRATLGSWPAGVNALNPGDSLNLGWITMTGQAKYRAVIHRVDNGGATKIYAVMVQALGAGPLGGRSGLTQMVIGAPAAGAGFVTLGDFGLNTGNTADSYNSTGCGTPATDGCYTETRDSSVSIVAGTTVDVHGAYVYGSIKAAGTINTAGTVLTGSATPNMSPSPVVAANYPTPACPAAYSPYSDVITGTNYTGTVTYTATDGQLVLGSGSHLILSDTPSTGYYYFDLLKVPAALDIAFSSPTPHPVTIYVHDKMVVSSSGIVNNLSKSPGNLKISTCLQVGDAASFSGHGISLTGGGIGYFQVYAPNQDVVVGGSGGGLWGSIVGLTIDATGSANLHYDKALGGGTALAWLSGGWAETQPF